MIGGVPLHELVARTSDSRHAFTDTPLVTSSPSQSRNQVRLGSAAAGSASSQSGTAGAVADTASGVDAPGHAVAARASVASHARVVVSENAPSPSQSR